MRHRFVLGVLLISAVALACILFVRSSARGREPPPPLPPDWCAFEPRPPLSEPTAATYFVQDADVLDARRRALQESLPDGWTAQLLRPESFGVVFDLEAAVEEGRPAVEVMRAKVSVLERHLREAWGYTREETHLDCGTGGIGSVLEHCFRFGGTRDGKVYGYLRVDLLPLAYLSREQVLSKEELDAKWMARGAHLAALASPLRYQCDPPAGESYEEACPAYSDFYLCQPSAPPHWDTRLLALPQGPRLAACATGFLPDPGRMAHVDVPSAQPLCVDLVTGEDLPPDVRLASDSRIYSDSTEGWVAFEGAAR